MKRVIKANSWYVGEPDSAEYGRAMSQAAKNLKTKYDPFEVKLVYWDKFSASSTGYVIDLEASEDIDYNMKEWYAKSGGGTFGNELTLYGPAVNEKISSSNYFDYEKQGTFQNINQVMNYLFQNA